MTSCEKQEIIVTANKLVGLLLQCDDYDFSEKTLYSVMSGVYIDEED